MPAMGVVSNRPRISPVAGLMEAIEEERAAWELIAVILPELSSAAPVFLSIPGPGKSQGREDRWTGPLRGSRIPEIGVLDRHHAQALRRDGRTGLGPVAQLKQARDVLRPQPSASDIQERPNHLAHHEPQE